MSLEYKLITSNEGLPAFNKQITELLNKGWELYGSLVSNVQSGQYVSSTSYAQALTRGTAGRYRGGKMNMTRKNRRNMRK